MRTPARRATSSSASFNVTPSSASDIVRSSGEAACAAASGAGRAAVRTSKPANVISVRITCLRLMLRKVPNQPDRAAGPDHANVEYESHGPQGFIERLRGERDRQSLAEQRGVRGLDIHRVPPLHLLDDARERGVVE